MQNLCDGRPECVLTPNAISAPSDCGTLLYASAMYSCIRKTLLLTFIPSSHSRIATVMFLLPSKFNSIADAYCVLVNIQIFFCSMPFGNFPEFTWLCCLSSGSLSSCSRGFRKLSGHVSREEYNSNSRRSIGRGLSP